MGKLHYVNRKIDGQKLAQVVAKDILKRIPPKPNHKAALRDPCVDFDISGKALDDDAFEGVASALVQAISYNGIGGNILKLEEACLKNNLLTARSLNFLAHVIRLAAHEIRDIDISQNLISIATPADALAWERFLRALEQCCVLRRLDVSGNPLGLKGIEIFAKVYLREPEAVAVVDERAVSSDITARDPRENTDIVAKGIMDLDLDTDANSSANRSIAPLTVPVGGGKTVQSASPPTTEQSPSVAGDKLLKLCSTTTGLRSIPYIILADTSIDDTCAMYLSYILPLHRLPAQLLPYVPPVKPGLAAQQERIYDQESECHGIVYKPNEHLGTVGAMLLALAEHERCNTEGTSSGTYGIHSSKDTSTPTKPRRKSGPAESISPATQSNKLERARSRIQGETLRDKGPRSNDLWWTSLKMLGVVRLLLLEPPRTRNAVHASSARPSTPAPLGIANPNAAIVQRWPQARKESIHAFNSPLQRLTEMKPISSRSYENGSTKGSAHQANKRFERSNLLGGLPARLWGEIIGLAVGAGTHLSSRQKQVVVEWGSRRETLEREMETLGKTEGVQIWRVLEGMECLVYEPLDA